MTVASYQTPKGETIQGKVRVVVVVEEEEKEEQELLLLPLQLLLTPPSHYHQSSLSSYYYYYHYYYYYYYYYYYQGIEPDVKLSMMDRVSPDILSVASSKGFEEVKGRTCLPQ